MFWSLTFLQPSHFREASGNSTSFTLLLFADRHLPQRVFKQLDMLRKLILLLLPPLLLLLLLLLLTPTATPIATTPTTSSTNTSGTTTIPTSTFTLPLATATATALPILLLLPLPLLLLFLLLLLLLPTPQPVPQHQQGANDIFPGALSLILQRMRGFVHWDRAMVACMIEDWMQCLFRFTKTWKLLKGKKKLPTISHI